MLLSKGTVLLAMAALTSPATLDAAGPVGDRFTLRCTGTREGAGATEPHSFEMRVDLQARKWCDDDCADVRSFAKVDRDQLTFSDSEDSLMKEFSYIDRRTGDFTQVFNSELVHSTTKAHCVRTAYKPIIYRKRQF